MMFAAMAVGAILVGQGSTPELTISDSGGCKVVSGVVEGVDIRAFLPADIQSGDKITGVVFEAQGGVIKPSEKFKITNTGGLSTPTTIGQGFSVGWVISTADKRNVATGQFFVPLDGAIASPAIPNYNPNAVVQKGTPIIIRGQFDGDLSTTKASTALGPMTVVAESPRATYVLPPSFATGTLSYTVQEGSQTPIKCETRVVTPLFSIKDPLIKVGSSTEANIGLLGLSGIEGQTIPMVLTNNSPNVVKLQGGNSQVIEVDKSKLDSNGAFRMDVPVTAIGAGRYELSLQTAMTSRPLDEDEVPDPIAVKVSGPGKIKANETATYTASCVPASNPPICVRFMYASVGGFTLQMGTDTDASDGWSAKLDGSKCPEGPGFVYAVAVTGQEHTARDQLTITVGSEDPSLPTFGNGTVQREFSNACKTLVKTTNASVLASISQMLQYESPIEEWDRKAAEARERAKQEQSAARQAQQEANGLEELDKELDALLGNTLGEMDKLVKELEDIKAKPGGNANKDDLKKKADELSDAAKKCKEDCDALQKALDKAKQDQKDLEQQMKDLAAVVDKAFHDDGWTGRAYFDPGAGIIRWGFVGDGNANHEINNYGSAANQQINNARKQKRELAKKLAAKKKEIEDLEAKVKACKENCADMEAAAQKAQTAAANAQAADVKESEIDALCHKFKELLWRIEDYLKGHPDLKGKLDKYLEAFGLYCPRDSKEMAKYANDLRALGDAKRQLEDEKKKEAQQHRGQAEAQNDAADAAQGVADQLREQQEQAEEQARARAAQRAKEQAEAERKAREAAERANKAKQEQEKKEAAARAQAFQDWLKDMMDKGIISSDGEELIQKLKESLGAGIEISTDLADGFAAALNQWMMNGSTGQITAAGAAQALVGLMASIYYWWIEAEMRGAIDRIKEKLEPQRLQELLLTIMQNFKGEPFGRVDIPGKGNESFFFLRKGNLIIIFKAERGKGLTVCYVGRADGQMTTQANS